MDRNGKPAKGQFYLCNEGSAGGHSVHGTRLQKIDPIGRRYQA
ncbi:MAG: hypothetical protein WBJ23_01285 [Anaerolineaceae bacterium]|nr:hypothetical protein [Chloroflexota bacterium]